MTTLRQALGFSALHAEANPVARFAQVGCGGDPYIEVQTQCAASKSLMDDQLVMPAINLSISPFCSPVSGRNGKRAGPP